MLGRQCQISLILGIFRQSRRQTWSVTFSGSRHDHILYTIYPDELKSLSHGTGCRNTKFAFTKLARTGKWWLFRFHQTREYSVSGMKPSCRYRVKSASAPYPASASSSDDWDYSLNSSVNVCFLIKRLLSRQCWSLLKRWDVLLAVFCHRRPWMHSTEHSTLLHVSLLPDMWVSCNVDLTPRPFAKSVMRQCPQLLLWSHSMMLFWILQYHQDRHHETLAICAEMISMEEQQNMLHIVHCRRTASSLQVHFRLTRTWPFFPSMNHSGPL